MKLTKRIIALVIVLCTLGAMMIPGVSVSAAETATTTLYDIKSVYSKYSDCQGWCYIPSNAAWKAIRDHYIKEDINWMIDSTSIMQARFNDYVTINGTKIYALNMQVGQALDTYFLATAFRVKAPATGTFTLNASYIQNGDDLTIRNAGAYVWEAPAEYYDAEAKYYYVSGNTSSTRGNTASLYYNSVQFKNSNEPVLEFHPYKEGATTNTLEVATGTKEFSMEAGKEYIIAFYVQNPADADKTDTVNAKLADFSLVQVVKSDYAVNYYANYEGAPVATVADSENVTGTTAAKAEITLDAPFVRAGYTFKGWATSADGDVVYQAGDKITLTPDAATADLYAVWKEAWDPANNGDWVVDLVDGGSGKYDITDIAGITTGSWISTNAANREKLNTAYEGGYNNWTFYTNNGTSVHSLFSTKNYTPGYLQLYSSENSSEFNTYGYLPILFKAPGTGSYTLSVTDSGVKWANDVDVSAHVFKVPAEGFTKASLKELANATDPLFTYNPTVDKETVATQKTFYSETGAVQLEGGEDYVLVLGIKAASSQQCAFIRGFALTEVKPAATVNGVGFETLSAAVAAGQGATVKLAQDASAEGILDLGTAVLDLNGYTVSASEIIGTVTDSTNGTGLIATSKESIITTGADELALWDNTTDAEGYRVFGYTFESLGVADDQDVATGVNKVIDLYEAQRVLAGPENLDENGEVIKGKGDQQYKDVADDLAALYADGTIDWRYEYTSQQYQMSRGGVCFSWGNKSLRHFGNGYSAIRIQAPAEGKVSVNVKTSSTGNEANDGGFDMYIVKASEIEALCTDYAANYEAFLAAPATAVEETEDAFTAAIAANKAVLTGISNGESYNGEFEFEAGKEYIVIFNNNGSVKSALHMNFQKISFTREEKNNDARTFWSQLAFTNTDAYALVAASDLQVGIKMDWNGNWKNFDFDAETVAAWAAEELANPEEDYGFYIRVSGFEKLTESGTLTGTPYIKVANKTVEATFENGELGAMTYEYTAPAAE